jgi:hypothetical protein
MARSLLWTSDAIRETPYRTYYTSFSMQWYNVATSGSESVASSGPAAADASAAQQPSTIVARGVPASAAHGGSAGAHPGVIVRVGDVVKCKFRNGERSHGLCLALVEQLWEVNNAPAGVPPCHQAKLRWFTQPDELPISKSRLPKQSQVCLLPIHSRLCALVTALCVAVSHG